VAPFEFGFVSVLFILIVYFYIFLRKMKLSYAIAFFFLGESVVREIKTIFVRSGIEAVPRLSKSEFLSLGLPIASRCAIIEHGEKIHFPGTCRSAEKGF
jgi:asparagine N-glycosylation enzyme membrane subunit Stt3